MILKDEDIEFIRFSKDCLNRGRYPHTEQLTEVYNRCFADRPNFKKIHNTNCGTCIKQRICELYGEMELILNKMVQNNNSCLNVVSDE